MKDDSDLALAETKAAGLTVKMIGRRIKQARENAGISQEELAASLKYKSPATISHFETGARKINIIDLRRLSIILGVSLESLIKDDGFDLNDAGNDSEVSIMTETRDADLKLWAKFVNHQYAAWAALFELITGSRPPKLKDVAARISGH